MVLVNDCRSDMSPVNYSDSDSPDYELSYIHSTSSSVSFLQETILTVVLIEIVLARKPSISSIFFLYFLYILLHPLSGIMSRRALYTPVLQDESLQVVM